MNGGTASHKLPPARLATVIAVIIILAGVILRLVGAWWYRHDMNPDYGIVSLMVKHIVEGRGIPVFFYGQPYMGSLEPMVSSALALAFGVNGLTVCLGTAIVGALLLPTVYGWARDTTGRTAALVALAFCVVGPPGFFHYMVSPRGGYAIVLVAGPLILWRVTGLAAREARRQCVSPLEYGIVGLLGGLAWWSTQLIAPAIATAAAVFFLACPRRCISRRSIWAPIAFFVGSSPFWIWNVLNGWETFRYMASMGTAPILQGLGTWAGDRLPHLLAIGEMPHKLRFSLAVLYLLLASAAIVETVSSCRRNGLRHAESLSLLSLWGFIAVSCLVASRSFYITLNTSRYLLPLVPVFAIVLAAGTRRLNRILPVGLGYIPIVILIGHQFWFMPGHVRRAAQNDARRPRIAELGISLSLNNIETIYAPFAQHALNFHMDEAFCFTDMKWERYAPYARKAELDQGPAFLNSYGMIRDFLKATGTTCSYGGVPLLGTCFDCLPPPSQTHLPPTEWVAMQSNGVIHVEFDTPTVVSGIRLICPQKDQPTTIGLAIREAGASRWEDLGLPETCTGFYWSGTRPYWRGRAPRIERRFPARAVDALRLHLTSAQERDVIVSDLTILQPMTGETRSEVDALADLFVAIEKIGARNVYSDRWVANRIHERMGPKIATFVEPQIADSLAAGALPDQIPFSPETAMVIRVEDVDVARKRLQETGITMDETIVAPWHVFHFSQKRPWAAPYAGVTNIAWAGVGPIMAK